MDKHPLGELMETTMQKIREMVDVNTIVGNPIATADGITVIPVSKVSFGFASGGTDFQGKNKAEAKPNNFGGGAGAGVTISPIGFLIVKDGNVRTVSIAPPASGAMDRLVDMLPGVMDQVKAYLDKSKAEKAQKPDNE